MTFDDELILIKTDHVTNEIGDVIPVFYRRAILCSVQSITRSEHYAAAANNLRPEIVFLINEYEYQAETMCEYRGKTYRIIRQYKKYSTQSAADHEALELICEEAAIDANA